MMASSKNPFVARKSTQYVASQLLGYISSSFSIACRVGCGVMVPFVKVVEPNVWKKKRLDEVITQKKKKKITSLDG